MSAENVATIPAALAESPDYEIVKELGHGGMGVVYLARNRMMDRLEVLKVVSRSLVERPGALERFQQEIRSAARLTHPNIVAAHSARRIGDLLVFVMEYVEGQDLAQVVKRRGPLPVTNAAFYAHQVALGLQHAHEKGMVHRDIKPNNIVLTLDGKKHVVKILDFGLAKATSEKLDDAGLTKSGQMLGTPDFIAPEQTLDAQKADIRADIYSLGCTLYYLLAGTPPFSGNSLYELLHAHHHAQAEPLGVLRPEVPPELAAVTARMIAKKPEERFQTPAEVAKALVPFFKPATQLPPSVSPATAAVGHVPAAPHPLAVGAMGSTVAGREPVAGQTPAVPPTPFPIAQPVLATAIPVAAMPAIMFPERPASRPSRRPIKKSRRPYRLLLAAGGLMILVAGAAMVLLKPTSSETLAVRTKPPDPVSATAAEPIVPTAAGTAIATASTQPRSQPIAPPTPQPSSLPIPQPTPKIVQAAPATTTPAANVPAAPAPGFIPLFNGRDLTGWKIRGPANWHVEDGVLIGSVPAASYLLSDRTNYRDFHLRVEAKLTGGKAGIVLRAPENRVDVGGHPFGYQVELTLAHGEPRFHVLHPTESIVSYATRPSPRALSQWFTMDVIALGNEFTVKVNDVVLIDYLDPSQRFSSGQLALALAQGPATVEFRRIEIKELSPPVATTAAMSAAPINVTSFDTNGDGKLDLQERSDAAKAFDANRDGQLDAKEQMEYGTALSSFARVPAASVKVGTVAARLTASDIFAKMDKNQDGLLSADEFIGKRVGSLGIKAKARFHQLDRDHSGSLTLGEFDDAMH